MWLGYKLSVGESYMLTKDGLFKVIGRFNISKHTWTDFNEFEWFKIKVSPN